MVAIHLHVASEHYLIQEGLIRYKGRLVVGKSHYIRVKVMQAIHGLTIGCHSGVHTSYLRAKKMFFWSGMKKDSTNFVLSYDICNQCKDEQVAYPGLLQPLEIPQQPWSSISNGFH